MSWKPIRPMALAISAVAIGFAIGARSVLSRPAEGASMRVLFDGHALEMKDAGSLEWFFRRGLMRGLASTRAHGDGLLLLLRPAPGVAIPTGSFEAPFVRFDDAGEVLEIGEVGEAPASNTCQTYWIQDTEDPAWWIVVCVGNCPPAGASCVLMFDAGTGTLACGCP